MYKKKGFTMYFVNFNGIIFLMNIFVMLCTKYQNTSNSRGPSWFFLTSFDGLKFVLHSWLDYCSYIRVWDFGLGVKS
jgi:hypothetical protein